MAARKRRPSFIAQRAMHRGVADFNARHPVGSTIRVWPGAINDRPPVEVTVVAPGAYVLSGHTAVVQVSGGHGCIALTHVMREAR